MKIVALLFASFFSIGFAYTETVKEVKPAAVALHAEVEQPVLHVTLDTIQVVASPAPLAVASK